MEGRWTIFLEGAYASMVIEESPPLYVPPGHEPVAVVPCDDAAIERVTAELRKRIVAPSNATEKLREIAVAALRAAGETP